MQENAEFLDPSAALWIRLNEIRPSQAYCYIRPLSPPILLMRCYLSVSILMGL